MKLKYSICFMLCILMCLAALGGCGTFTAVNLPNPNRDIETFFKALSREDYSEVDKYIYNYASLGFEQNGNISELQSQMYSALTRSRCFQLISCEVSGNKATAQISFTTLDLAKLSEALESSTAESLPRLQSEGLDCSDDEGILNAAAQVLTELLAQPQKYNTTKSFSLPLIYDDGRWNIYIEDDFYAALLGYAI